MIVTLSCRELQAELRQADPSSSMPKVCQVSLFYAPAVAASARIHPMGVCSVSGAKVSYAIATLTSPRKICHDDELLRSMQMRYIQADEECLPLREHSVDGEPAAQQWSALLLVGSSLCRHIAAQQWSASCLSQRN